MLSDRSENKQRATEGHNREKQIRRKGRSLAKPKELRVYRLM